jgi:hypothetical protein
MADDGATRTRRWKLHKQGNHSMCRGSCSIARGSPTIVPVPSGSGKDLDPDASMRDLAARLEVAHRADPGNGVLARELRSTLLVLMPTVDAAMDAEWKQVMAELSRPVPRSETRDWFDDGG